MSNAENLFTYCLAICLSSSEKCLLVKSFAHLSIMFIVFVMDRQNMVYIYYGVLFSLLKEGNLAICENMENLGDIVRREISQL